MFLRESLVRRSERFRRHIVPTSAAERLLGVVRPEAVQFQELVQIAVIEILEDDTVRLFVSANCQNTRQMRVV